jgi:hypothetical protein
VYLSLHGDHRKYWLTLEPDVAEILPFGLRAKGMSIYVTTQSVSLAFNQYVNPVALTAIGKSASTNFT